MPVELQNFGDKFSAEEAGRLWRAVCEYTKHADDEVVVRVVDEQESRRLNFGYRSIDSPTNVLTFNYEDSHDIALCLLVAEREASERGAAWRDYVARLLVHAFLHAAGFDHERSEEEARRMHQAEKAILPRAGFAALFLA